MKQAHRFNGKGKAYEGLTKQTSVGPQWTGKVSLVESALLKPLQWQKPQRIFVNSMSDLFHEAVPDEFIDRIFAVMARAPHHTFQVLTKRPERMRSYIQAADISVLAPLGRAIQAIPGHRPAAYSWPLPNVWLGVSCEDQQRADERIPLLLQTPAALRFVSAEPLIGPIRFKQQNPDGFWPPNAAQPDVAWLRHRDWPDDFQYWTTGLGWVIVGGESGPGARPCDVAWLRSIVKQCQMGRVPVFVKQVGAVPRLTGPCSLDEWTNPCTVTAASGGTHVVLKNRKGSDPAEWPESYRVREFPQVQR
jgi:protein gp37